MRICTLCSWLLLFAAAVVGLGGCLGGASAPTKYCTLAPVVSQPAENNPASPDLALGIGPVMLPASLDRPQIVTRQGAEELTLVEFDRWAEPLRAGVPRVLADKLTALLGTDRIAIFILFPPLVGRQFRIAPPFGKDEAPVMLSDGRNRIGG